jgi:hypothetical protein
MDKGSDSESRSENYHRMMKELLHWFWRTYGFKYGGIDCMAIREASLPQHARQHCWKTKEDVYFKVREILASNGISMDRTGCHAS